MKESRIRCELQDQPLCTECLWGLQRKLEIRLPAGSPSPSSFPGRSAWCDHRCPREQGSSTEASREMGLGRP